MCPPAPCGPNQANDISLPRRTTSSTRPPDSATWTPPPVPQGGELFQYIIDHWPLGEETVRRFFQQLICAVEHIHYFRCPRRSRGIVGAGPRFPVPRFAPFFPSHIDFVAVGVSRWKGGGPPRNLYLCLSAPDNNSCPRTPRDFLGISLLQTQPVMTPLFPP